MNGFSLLILVLLGLAIQVGIIGLGVNMGTKGIRADLAELKGKQPIVPN